MSILITGGNGKTGSKLAKLLHQAGKSFVVASRKGEAPAPYRATQFDWFDPSTFENPFKTDPGIKKVYTVFPTTIDPLPILKPFVELAIAKGVDRFVVLTARDLVEDNEKQFPPVKLHKYFKNLGVGYAIIRPSWFMENFATSLLPAIKFKSMVPSVAKDGKVPSSPPKTSLKQHSTRSVVEKDPNYERFVLGPELYTYDEALALLSEVIGRQIQHVRFTEEQIVQLYTSVGLPLDYAEFLALIQKRVGEGMEASIPDEENVVVGKKTLRSFFEENKHLWV